MARHSDDKDDALEKVLKQAWAHYRNYVDPEIDDDDDEDGNDDEVDVDGEEDENAKKEKRQTDKDTDSAKKSGGDVDELYEVLAILKASHYIDEEDKANPSPALGWWKRHLQEPPAVPLLPSEFQPPTNDTTSDAVLDCQKRFLLSMTYYSLANHAMEMTMAANNQHGEETNDDASVEWFLAASLEQVSHNAATLAVLANYCRIHHRGSMAEIAQLYQVAAQQATQIRTEAIQCLSRWDDHLLKEQTKKTNADHDQDMKEDEDASLAIPEWIELLVLNGLLGVEFVGDDEDEEEEDDDMGEEEKEAEEKKNETQDGENDNENDPSKKKKELSKKRRHRGTSKSEEEEVPLKKRKQQEEENDNDNSEKKQDAEWSFSKVEAACRFMAAMLYSTMGQHAKALPHLQTFHVTHRIHPGVWEAASSSEAAAAAASAANVLAHPKENHEAHKPPLDFEPFRLVSDSCNTTGVLPPEIYQRLLDVFGPSSSYWNESSYLHRGYFSFHQDLGNTKDAPQNLVQDVIQTYLLPHVQKLVPRETIVQVEWWTHTRSMSANLGHQLHFDTDEGHLRQTGQVSHPIVSSVLYLTGGNGGGGATMVLHQGVKSSKVATDVWLSKPVDNSLLLFPGHLLHGVLPCRRHEQSATTTPAPYRLTFMVGFWTRRVDGGSSSDSEIPLYGPCGPLPPPTKEHSWVQEIGKGYPMTLESSPVNQTAALQKVALPRISPAWQTIDLPPDGTSCLEIPHALDHRFFVRNAPDCFYQSLSEKHPNEEDENDG